MSIAEKINADIVTAMKAHHEHRLTTLRMVKSALRSKEIDKRQPLTEAEQTQILSTLLKQRRESVESFTKGNRPELAAKEQAEIVMIEAYMPQAAGEDQIREIVVAGHHQTRRNQRSEAQPARHGRRHEACPAEHPGHRPSRRRQTRLRIGQSRAGQVMCPLPGRKKGSVTIEP